MTGKFVCLCVYAERCNRERLFIIWERTRTRRVWLSIDTLLLMDNADKNKGIERERKKIGGCGVIETLAYNWIYRDFCILFSQWIIRQLLVFLVLYFFNELFIKKLVKKICKKKKKYKPPNLVLKILRQFKTCWICESTVKTNLVYIVIYCSQ